MQMLIASHDVNFSALQLVGPASPCIEGSMSQLHILERSFPAPAIMHCISHLVTAEHLLEYEKEASVPEMAVRDVACHFTILQAYAGTHVALAETHSKSPRH